MKKGLFSILAGALLVVGCQNYDDQFSNIESQITALASQVAGLSQVQSDLTSLANTVNSLQTSVAETVNTALADGLADIDTAVASLEAATATAASSEDVAAIATAVQDNQDDLTELLSASSVFSGAVVVNSVATLDAYHSMGDNLAIVANSVTINPTAEMDATKLAELSDVFLTITGDLNVTSAASTIAELVFTNLTGVSSLTMKQAGGYHFPVLGSASTIYLDDAYESTILRVNFPALASVTSMGTDSRTNGTIEFTKATSMNFAALPRYAGSLTLTTKKGKADDVVTMDITALRDVDAAGTQAALNLSISGPNVVTVSAIDGKAGTLTLANVLTATVTDYDGGIVINGGVETFTSNNVVELSGTMSDVTTIDITGVLDPNNATGTTADKSGPAIDFNGRVNLVTATLAGNFASIDVRNNGNVETLIITADVNNGDIDIDGNTDLETITLTGAKASGVIVNNNVTLSALTVDATMQKTLGTATTAATLDGSITVTNNADLESLTIAAASVSVLDIRTNPSLETINGTGLTSLGATAKSNNVKISGNNFSASIAQDKTNAAACTKCANLEVNDLGGFTTSSGMATMKVYLGLVAANTAATSAAYWDKVESTTGATGIETKPETTGAVDFNAILVLTAEVATAAQGDIAAQRAFILNATTGSIGISKNTLGRTPALFAGTTASSAASAVLVANKDLLIADLKKTATVDRMAAYDITIDAKRGGNSTGTVSLLAYGALTGNATTLVLGQRYTTTTANAAAVSTTNYGIGLDDEFTLTVGGTSLTVSQGSSGGATTLAGIAITMTASWTAKFGTTGTASATSVAVVSIPAAGKLLITMLDTGTPGYAQNIDFGVKSGKVTATNAANLDYVIGATRLESDDPTIDDDVVLILTSITKGTLVNAISGLSTGGAGFVELTTTKLTNAAVDPTSGVRRVAGSSADVVTAENGTPKVVTTAGQTKTRVHWL